MGRKNNYNSLARQSNIVVNARGRFAGTSTLASNSSLNATIIRTQKATSQASFQSDLDVNVRYFWEEIGQISETWSAISKPTKNWNVVTLPNNSWNNVANPNETWTNINKPTETWTEDMPFQLAS